MGSAGNAPVPGNIVVDPARFATKIAFSRKFPEMSYIGLKPFWMAAGYFSTDDIIATMRAEHVAYYKRVFGYTSWSTPRRYPRLNKKIVCMGADYHAVKDRVEAGFLYLRSSKSGQDNLFGHGRTNRYSFRDESHLYQNRQPIWAASGAALAELPSLAVQSPDDPFFDWQGVAVDADAFVSLTQGLAEKANRLVEAEEKRRATVSERLSSWPKRDRACGPKCGALHTLGSSLSVISRELQKIWCGQEDSNLHWLPN
jgi:hypothetical protein